MGEEEFEGFAEEAMAVVGRGLPVDAGEVDFAVLVKVFVTSADKVEMWFVGCWHRVVLVLQGSLAGRHGDTRAIETDIMGECFSRNNNLGTGEAHNHRYISIDQRVVDMMIASAIFEECAEGGVLFSSEQRADGTEVEELAEIAVVVLAGSVFLIPHGECPWCAADILTEESVIVEDEREEPAIAADANDFVVVLEEFETFVHELEEARLDDIVVLHEDIAVVGFSYLRFENFAVALVSGVPDAVVVVTLDEEEVAKAVPPPLCCEDSHDCVSNPLRISRGFSQEDSREQQRRRCARRRCNEKATRDTGGDGRNG